MNTITFAEFKDRFAHRVRVRTRLLDPQRQVTTFSGEKAARSLSRIYVINLDRKPDRWRRLRRELDRFYGGDGQRLTAFVRRISAVDARYMSGPLDPAVLRPAFTLADQLTVDPNPLLAIDDQSRAHIIEMTNQEVAVALSHIEAWRRMATGSDAAALILEDDVVMTRGFARRLRATWDYLFESEDGFGFDLLFLAYKNVDASMTQRFNQPVRRTKPGVWEAAAYVLTRTAAQELLDRLPAFGPIDLWLNLQFETTRTYTSGRPLIEQRIDEPSSNSYSVLPVLSQVGIINDGKAALPPSRKLPGPVIGVGKPGSGLTSLATALSMVGYTCLSDADAMPADEVTALRRGDRRRMFNAYVNVAPLDMDAACVIAQASPRALFVLTSPDATDRLPSSRVLNLRPEVEDKWNALSEFLSIEYPAFRYPTEGDVGQREVSFDGHTPDDLPPSRDLKSDVSPWILSRVPDSWSGVRVTPRSDPLGPSASVKWSLGEELHPSVWRLRNDTFPSNLALFSSDNVVTGVDGLDLTIRREPAIVRDFTAAAVASHVSYRYGTFSAELRPAKGAGLITGLFLHRNGPRQEIDIEFLGRDTSTMLVNVFYNPGPEGSKLEYGYRGTPTEISLGFDAADEFHLYEIDWQPERIRWKVDGLVVYERHQWSPTPIPDGALEFNLNVWHSRSAEFAGKLDPSHLPGHVSVRSIEIVAGRH
ncbi:family 16 glycosylhydrolase [Aeromicrobium sp. CF3.5]|uniref:family 16 glycosylhydrolase n=1 Tax=Aeromicrobium sp. CF3.5 TaxID=3373078 RepID=UPI003EE76E7B